MSCSSMDKSARDLASVDRPPQYVLMAFDGSKNLDMWEETTAFAKEHNVKFTYFISGVYFVSQGDRKRYYSEPRMGPGVSAIGWGKDEADISKRFRAVRDAIEAGHEIASHANAHFTGQSFTNYKGKKIRAFSEEDWSSELSQFKTIMTDGVRRYDVRRMPAWWESYFDEKNVGFRAPQLGYNKAMFPALVRNGYTYDTSKSTQMSYWPRRSNGVWNFPLAGLKMTSSGKNTLSMDYNFYYKHSKGKKGPERKWKDFENEMYNTYMNYFKHNYFGNRAPLDIGHHFSKWNGGAYWRALKSFAQTVCSQPEVKCVTYAEFQDFLESEGSDKIASFQAGKFKKMKPSEVYLPGDVKRSGGFLSGIGAKRKQILELSDDEILKLREELPPLPHDEDEGPNDGMQNKKNQR